MRIAELYQSIQGEGLLTGQTSVFVRASGCNLRCSFCDTPYASWRPEGQDLSVDEIVRQVLAFDCEHVVITGGEPMLFAELIPVTARLKSAGKHITIETAGTLHLPVVCDLMSISPKMSNSTPIGEGAWTERHERTRESLDVVQRFMREYEYQLKFVIDSPADCEEVEEYLGRLEGVERNRVLLMPQGTDEGRLSEIGSWLTTYCEKHGYGWCPRKHIEWFGAVRGT